MSKKVYRLSSSQNLINFMKRFSVIEKQLLFEINDNEMIAKTYTVDKSVVKVSTISLDNIFSMDDVSSENVKIGLFSVDNFVSSFKNFTDDDLSLEITSEKVGNEMIGTELKLFSKNLKILFPCASMSMFKYIDETMISNITNSDETIFSFIIDRDSLAKIADLSKFDSDNNTLSITSKDGEIFFKGKVFEMLLPGSTSETDGSISFFKSHFSFIDKEEMEVFVLDSKIIFKSNESNTIIVIGKVE